MATTTEIKNTAFKDALDKFVHIGNFYYNGKHADNVLNIFADLTEEDRKTLLQGVYHVYSYLEFGVMTEPPTRALKPKTDDDLSKTGFNNEQMADLKVWFVKMLSFVILGGIFFVLGLIIYFSSGSSYQESTGGFWKVISIIFEAVFK